MKRLSNLEGAFPLLLIGSALLVYAAIIANQEIAAHNTHLPLWGLIGAVGVVIAGAGVYSTFLEGPPTPVPVPPSDAVLVSKAEYDRMKTPPAPSRSPAPPPKMPEWWEGPPEPPAPRPAAEAVPASYEEELLRLRTSGRPAPRGIVLHRPAGPAVATGPAAPPTRAPSPSVPRPAGSPTTTRTSLRELKSALSELETLLDREFTPTSRTAPVPAPKGVPACADCRRALAKSPVPNECSGCGKGLCNDCALSSQFEDGDLRCIECRARDPWPRRPAR